MKLLHTRLALTAVLLFAAWYNLSAQSSTMTDQQVMEYVMRENEKGTDRATIVKKLIEKGVPVSQIQRIKKKYEREKSSASLGAKDLSGKSSTEDRLRKNNGDEKKDKKSGFSQRQTTKKRDKSTMSERRRKLYEEELEETYDEEADFMFPDSMAMYDEMFGVKEKEDKIKVFGRDIFNQKNLTFEPEMNIAMPQDYRLGPGDAVYVDIYGASQKSFNATVSPEGVLDIEGYGPVQVSGLTVSQANARLKQTLGSRFQGSNIRLSVGQTRSISVNVVGEVEMPGTYTLSAFATVFHALYMAGGPNEIGTLRDIKVYRDGRQISTVDVYDYILGGHHKGNVRLASGDMIIVGPYDCLVNVTGKVKRPMYYEMKSRESVGTLIKYAGGFAGDAYTQSVRLVRKSGGMHSVYTIDEFERNSFQLQDGDSLAVDSVLNRFSNMVEVRGAVFRPGMYQMDGNITTVRQVIEKAGGLTEDAIKARAVMHRRKDNRRLEVIALDIEGILSHNVPDVSLKNEDIIFVPGDEELLADRKLTIKGEVLYPGDYEYAENTTIEDLILQAGGLTDAASVMRVDVSRRVVNQNATTAQAQLAESYSFDLKDGFVVKGTPGFTLQPYDEVFVRRSPGYNEQEHVTIKGEVAFAGDYVLTKKNYRLSDLIKAAGGLNEDAFASGARLERTLTSDEKIKLVAMQKTAIAGDSVDLRKLELQEIRNIGINLDKAVKKPGTEEWDIVLRGGDVITVPQITNTVSINGEVLYPNTVAYKKGAKLSYYIDQSGGYSTKAKRSKVFAVNMNGTVSRVKSAKDIQPGCEIVVPAKSKKRGMSLTEILSLGSITATLAAVVATLVK